MTFSKYFWAAGLVVLWTSAAPAAEIELINAIFGSDLVTWDVVYDPDGETGIASLQQNIGVVGDPNDNVSDVSGTDSGDPNWGVDGFADLGDEIIYGGLNFTGDIPTPGPITLGTFSVAWNGQGTVDIVSTFSEFLAGQPAVELPNTTAAVLATLMEPVLSGELTKDQQKCVNTTNKNAQKIGDAQGKDIAACIKNRAKGKNSDADACAISDPKGKVGKAEGKYDQKTTKDCGSGSGYMLLADAATAKAAAKNKELDILHTIFGSDTVDALVIQEANNKTDSKCQQALIKAVYKCQTTKWKEYNKCKKNKIKGKDTAQAATAQELQDECLGTGAGSIPDGKGKIAKKCDFAGTISKKCPNTNVFPAGCGAGTGAALNACLDAVVECKVCLALNAIDGLNRDCDLFDDGASNGSCP